MAPRDDHGQTRPTCPACGYIHYRNPVPAAGVILQGPRGVLLVQRRYEPRAGEWKDVRLGFQVATGVRARLTGLFGVYAGFDDPRVRAVLILYTAERTGGRRKAGDDALDARYVPLTRLPKRIAFEAHARALEEFRRRA